MKVKGGLKLSLQFAFVLWAITCGALAILRVVRREPELVVDIEQQPITSAGEALSLPVLIDGKRIGDTPLKVPISKVFRSGVYSDDDVVFTPAGVLILKSPLGVTGNRPALVSIGPHPAFESVVAGNDVDVASVNGFSVPSYPLRGDCKIAFSLRRRGDADKLALLAFDRDHMPSFEKMLLTLPSVVGDIASGPCVLEYLFQSRSDGHFSGKGKCVVDTDKWKTNDDGGVTSRVEIVVPDDFQSGWISGAVRSEDGTRRTTLRKLFVDQLRNAHP